MLYSSNISKYKTNTWKSTNPVTPPPHTFVYRFIVQKRFHLHCLLRSSQQSHHTDEKTEAHRGIMLVPPYHALRIRHGHAQMNTYLHSSCANGTHGGTPKDVDIIFPI